MAASPDSTIPQVHGFAASMENAKRALEEEGYAVVPGVLTKEECNNAIAEYNKWLAKFGGVGFPDNRWSLIHKYNIHQHPATWSVRLKTVPVFEALFGTQKLLSSFDSVAIGQPPVLAEDGSVQDSPAHRALKLNEGARNLHLDQGGLKKGLHAFQGAVYLEECAEDDWSLAVMARSHKQHDDFFDGRPLDPTKKEFTALTEGEIAWYKERGCDVRRVPVPKGGMVLWDSRVVHAGAPPLPTRKNPDRWRYVVFVCMVPAAWASPEELEKKKDAFNNMHCSRHWPAQGFETFKSATVPAEYLAVDELPEIARTPQVRLLAGDLQYDFNDGKPNGPPKPMKL